MNELEFTSLYQVGSELDFEAVQPSSLTTALKTTIFRVEIFRLLDVAFDRRNQVAVVRIVAPELTAGPPEKYVAKFYDPFSDLRAEPCHHPDGPVQARTERRDREIS